MNTIKTRLLKIEARQAMTQNAQRNRRVCPHSVAALNKAYGVDLGKEATMIPQQCQQEERCRDCPDRGMERALLLVYGPQKGAA